MNSTITTRSVLVFLLGFAVACGSDDDDDGDGLSDTDDNCPLVVNPTQLDFDMDQIGDSCDSDDDGDGVLDTLDQCPMTIPGEEVAAESGCTIDELCPCEGPRGTTNRWKTHGQFVSCITNTLHSMQLSRHTTNLKAKNLVAKAAQSNCGRSSIPQRK